MCGRYLFSEKSDYPPVQKAIQSLTEKGIHIKQGEVCPGDLAAVMASNRRGEPSVFAMKWGFPLSDGKLVFNARSESAAGKAMFADGMKQRRCLIPADAYYEWQKLEHGRQKYLISTQHSKGILLAGIYRLLENSRGEFTILTRPPAESVSFIHDRMPVILPEEAVCDWLNPRYRGEDILRCAVNEMTYTAI